MTKQLILFGTAVMTTLLALVLLWQFRVVVVYVLISLAFAATVRPFFRGWSRRAFVMRLALVLLCLLSLGVFGFLIFQAGRIVIGDIQELGQMLSVQGTWRLPPWLDGSSFQQTLVTWLPTPDKLFEAVTGEQGQLVLPALLGFTEGVGGFVSGVFIVIFLSLYWSINQVHFERLWLSLLPSELRGYARGIWRTIEPDLGAYIRSEIVQSILAGLLLGIGYWLLGSPYSALLALIGALAWLIPVVGAALAVIPPLIVGLLTDVQLSLFTALYTLIVLIALQVWVEPRLFKRNWDNPIMTLVMLLVMADAFGLFGLVIAPPLSAICQTLWKLLFSDRLASGVTVQVSNLKERQVNLWNAIKEMDELPPPLVISSMDRLADLLEKAEPILPVALPDESSDLFHPSQSVTGEGELPGSTNPE
jgi:predicted PurR-regulated permease PerM